MDIAMVLEQIGDAKELRAERHRGRAIVSGVGARPDRRHRSLQPARAAGTVRSRRSVSRARHQARAHGRRAAAAGRFHRGSSASDRPGARTERAVASERDGALRRRRTRRARVSGVRVSERSVASRRVGGPPDERPPSVRDRHSDCRCRRRCAWARLRDTAASAPTPSSSARRAARRFRRSSWRPRAASTRTTAPGGLHRLRGARRSARRGARRSLRCLFGRRHPVRNAHHAATACIAAPRRRVRRTPRCRKSSTRSC